MSDCRCTQLTGQTPWEPAEWEQADDCPVHPLMTAPGTGGPAEDAQMDMRRAALVMDIEAALHSRSIKGRTIPELFEADWLHEAEIATAVAWPLIVLARSESSAAAGPEDGGEALRREGMAEALGWAADWLDEQGLGDEISGHIRANARAAAAAAVRERREDETAAWPRLSDDVAAEIAAWPPGVRP